VPSFSELEFN